MSRATRPQAPRAMSANSERPGPPAQLAPHPQTLQEALRQEHRWYDRRERHGDPDPAPQAVRGQEDVVPVLEPEVDRLEQKPDHRGPPQHRGERAGPSEERLAAQEDYRLVENKEGRVPRHDVEPRGEGRDFVQPQQDGGGEDRRRRRESRAG